MDILMALTEFLKKSRDAIDDVGGTKVYNDGVVHIVITACAVEPKITVYYLKTNKKVFLSRGSRVLLSERGPWEEHVKGICEPYLEEQRRAVEQKVKDLANKVSNKKKGTPEVKV